MGTVGSTNAGLNDLLQTLTSIGSPLTSTLSTPALQSALQNASPSDIVKLSDAALELQSTDALFGVSDTSGSTNVLSQLESGGSTASGSPAEQNAAAQADLQAQETAALFGTSTSSNGLLNVMG